MAEAAPAYTGRQVSRHLGFSTLEEAASGERPQRAAVVRKSRGPEPKQLGKETEGWNGGRTTAFCSWTFRATGSVQWDQHN